MNKYFLPVYHSELKPWIKWWILKRLNGGQSSLKAITITSGTLTKVDKSKALSIKEYYGNTVQNGTPTPESPVEIKTISGNITFTINGGDYKLDLKSKNLFNKDIPDDNKNKRLNTSGGFYSDNGYFISDAIEVLPNTKYTVNYTVTTLSRICYYTGKSVSTFISKNDSNATFTTPSNCYYVRFCNLLTNIDSIQFEEGSISTDYESYYNYYELCKIGDYKDKIYNVGGTWKIEKNIGKVVLNGTRTWSSSSAYTGYARFNCDALPETVTDNNGLNTHFIERVSQPHGGYDYLYISVNSKKIYVQIQNSIASSVSDFTTWLSNNNVTVYYIKPTPTYETITNTNLISELNALYEFYVNSSKVTISNNSEIPLEVLLEYYGR